jgi:hypothetical protein
MGGIVTPIWHLTELLGLAFEFGKLSTLTTIGDVPLGVGYPSLAIDSKRRHFIVGGRISQLIANFYAMGEPV